MGTDIRRGRATVRCNEMHNKSPLHARARGRPGRQRVAWVNGGRGNACVLPETDRPRQSRACKKRKRTGEEKNPGEKDGIGARPREGKTDRLNQQPAASAGKISARSLAQIPLALFSRCHLHPVFTFPSSLLVTSIVIQNRKARATRLTNAP